MQDTNYAATARHFNNLENALASEGKKKILIIYAMASHGSLIKDS